MKLVIQSKREGFRRAGRAWSEAPAIVESADFSKDQLKALRDEPMLLIEEVTGKEAAEIKKEIAAEAKKSAN